MAVPRWSPDGKGIAVIEGLMSDEGITGGDVFLVPVDGGEAFNLTPDMKASASWIAWLDPKRIFMIESLEGHSAFAGLDVADREISTIWEGEEAITAGGFNGAVSLIARRQDPGSRKAVIPAPARVVGWSNRRLDSNHSYQFSVSTRLGES